MKYKILRKQRMKFKIAILFCYLAEYRIFDPLTKWYLRRNGFEMEEEDNETD